MSQSLAAAKKRRAPAQQSPMPPTPSPNTTSSPTTGLTLQQVILLMDKRIVNLEKSVNENRSQMRSMDQPATQIFEDKSVDFSNIIEEFNNRTVLLAEEIANLKNIVLSLQTYTMEVNKTLMEDRIRILSDTEEPTSISIHNEIREERNQEPSADGVEIEDVSQNTMNYSTHILDDLKEFQSSEQPELKDEIARSIEEINKERRELLFAKRFGRKLNSDPDAST
jgi:hypothetical protein